jgi:protein-L-isoaspartate(D-aspartate) O-methyltransferase
MTVPVERDSDHEAEASVLRERMVASQLIGRDITDERVLNAMGRVPRHEFAGQVPLSTAYGDYPVPIGFGQTISQPYIVALMTQLGRFDRQSRVLDVGTGCGYQAAVLSELVEHVWSLEIVPELAESARNRLRDLGYLNVDVVCRDAFAGLPEQAPFDLILCAAAPASVPTALVEQLAPRGRLVIPIGTNRQELFVFTKSEDGTVDSKSLGAVSFVPMTGDVAGE